jgi:hypothetical protein
VFGEFGLPRDRPADIQTRDKQDRLRSITDSTDFVFDVSQILFDEGEINIKQDL